MKKMNSLADTMKMLEALSSPSMKAMEAQAATMKALEALSSPSMKAMEAQAATMKALEALGSPSMKAMEAQIATMKAAQALIDSPSMKYFESIAVQHQRLLKGLSATEKLGGLAEIAGYMQRQPALALSVSAKMGAIQKALYEFDSSPEAYDPVAIETLFVELIDGLIDFLGQAVEKIEIRSVFVFVVPIFSLLLSFYFFQASSNQIEELREDNRRLHNETVDVIAENKRQSEERGDRLINRWEKLENKFDELSESKNPFEGTFYIVDRPVPLTVERRFHGTVVCWLLSSQVVELIERSGKWIRVIAYDFVTGRTEVGWVMKKYLRRIQ